MGAWDRVVGQLIARPRLSLGAGALLVLACAAAAPGVAFTTDATETLPRVSPKVIAWLELSGRFDAFNTLIVGLEEPGAPLTTEGLERLKRVTTRLAGLKAAGVLAVTSLANVESVHEGADGSLETELLVAEIPREPASLKALSEKIAADQQVSGALISRDQEGYLILLRGDPRRDAAGLALEVERVVEEERGPLSSAYFGAAFFSRMVTRGVYARLVWLVPAFVLLLLAVLAFTVRRPAAIALVLGVDALALVVWLGLVRGAGATLSFTSLPVLLLLTVLGAIVFSRGLAAREAGPDDAANPFPASVLTALVAVGLAAVTLRWNPVGFLAALWAPLALGPLAIGGVGLLVFVPLAGRLTRMNPPAQRPAAPSAAAGVVAAVLFGAAGFGASQARFFSTPQTVFSPTDEVGRSLAFFDRRFGGPDFIQLDFKGDLRSPEVAARLLRLTDLLEGTEAFADVRSVAQVLAFLNHGFGGVHRVPPSKESLGNLWFLLEGRSDVRSLVSSGRDEAMGVLRVPSVRTRTTVEYQTLLDAAVAKSLELGATSARARLLAIARSTGFKLERPELDSVLVRAVSPIPAEEQRALDAAVLQGLHAWLSSPDSPWQPAEADWSRVSAALGKDRSTLATVTTSFEGFEDPAAAAQLSTSILEREAALRLDLRAQFLAAWLWPGAVTAPEAFKVRATGVLADLLDPQPGPGASAQILVSGLPIVAEQVEKDLLTGLWSALLALTLAGGLGLLVLTRRPTAALRATASAWLAATLTLALAGALGPGADAGSASLFLLPPLAALLLSGAPGRAPLGFLLALAGANLSLLWVGLSPVTRLGLATAVGLAVVVMVEAAARRFTPADRDALK